MECLELNSGCVMMRVERNETGRNRDADPGHLIQEMPQDSGENKRIKLLPISQINFHCFSNHSLFNQLPGSCYP